MHQNKRFVVTVNPEILVMAKKQPELDGLLLDEGVTLVPDGISVVKACSMLGVPVAERITGVEVCTYLLEELDRQAASLFLFGAQPEVVRKLADRLAAEFPKIRLLGYSDGYVSDKDGVFDRICEMRPDVCLVALGVPAQERLIYKHIDRFDKGIS